MIKLDRNSMAALHQAACRSLGHSHHNALSEIQALRASRNVWETIFVGHFCREMVNVASLWGGVLSSAAPGTRLSMATVFTHATPCVTWVSPTKRRCELADILVAIIDRNVGTGAATLIQAKLSNTASFSCKNQSERTQFELLSTRPVFDVDVSSSPKGINLGQLSPDNALLYGLTSPTSHPIRGPFPGRHDWLTADRLLTEAGRYRAASSDCLAYVLVGLIAGRCGWEFDLPLTGNGWKSIPRTTARDEWSTLINYLLEETLVKPLSARHRVSIGQPSRGHEDVMYLSAENEVGKRMFCHAHNLANTEVDGRFGRAIQGDLGGWEQSEPSNSDTVLGGNGGMDGNEPITPSDEPPEHGPISVVIFEIGREED